MDGLILLVFIVLFIDLRDNDWVYHRIYICKVNKKILTDIKIKHFFVRIFISLTLCTHTVTIYSQFRTIYG